MKTCALLTSEDLSQYVTDEHFLESALKQAGWDFQWVPWDSDEVDWNQYQCAIIRTTWDYTKRLDRFLEKMKNISHSSCQLFNDFELVKWNSHKTYLKDLSRQGVKIIPTQWETKVEPGILNGSFKKLNTAKIVVKPMVGAGSVNTFLVEDSQIEKIREIEKSLNGQAAMIQPYMERVATEGEYSAFCFGGEVSHAILKQPKAGDFRSQEEFGSRVGECQLSQRQKQFSESVIEKIKRPWLFARVDFIHDLSGDENLIELEMIEPSLFFRYKEGSAEKLVLKLDQLIEENQRS